MCSSQEKSGEEVAGLDDGLFLLLLFANSSVMLMQ